MNNTGMMSGKKNKSGFAGKTGTFFLAAILVGSAWVSWIYRKELKVPLIHLENSLQQSHIKRDQVRCFVATNIDGNHYLRVKLAIPCGSRKQRLNLTRNLPRFKNELMMKMSDPEMKEAVKNRDFETLRYHIKKILNSILKKPVTNVYFEAFFYD